MREPDIRCEWFSGCARPATASALWRAGGFSARSYCATHASLRAAQDFAPDRVEPLCRDPRPVAILCGAIAGAIPPDARDVIADYIAHGDPSPLLDLAEQRGLHEGGYGPERYEEWPEATEHVHVWLPWESGDAERTLGVFPGFRDASRFRRCTCGVFEHEERDCWDLRCQRERGHAGPHRARWPLHGYGGIEEQIDEWSDVDTVALEVLGSMD